MHLACMGESRNIYIILAGRPEKKKYNLRDLSIVKQVIIQLNLGILNLLVQYHPPTHFQKNNTSRN